MGLISASNEMTIHSSRSTGSRPIRINLVAVLTWPTYITGNGGGGIGITFILKTKITIVCGNDIPNDGQRIIISIFCAIAIN